LVEQLEGDLLGRGQHRLLQHVHPRRQSERHHGSQLGHVEVEQVVHGAQFVLRQLHLLVYDFENPVVCVRAPLRVEAGLLLEHA